jgi:hypothetical protein
MVGKYSRKGTVINLKDEDNIKEQPHNEIKFFNGICAHQTEEFEGIRVSIIFLLSRWESFAEGSMKSNLADCGFKLEKSHPKIRCRQVSWQAVEEEKALANKHAADGYQDVVSTIVTEGNSVEVNHDICLNTIETNEDTEEASTLSKAVAAKLLAKYYIGSAEEADQELRDEEYSFKVADLSNYDLTDEFVEEQGGEAVPVAQYMMAEVKETTSGLSQSRMN